MKRFIDLNNESKLFLLPVSWMLSFHESNVNCIYLECSIFLSNGYIALFVQLSDHQTTFIAKIDYHMCCRLIKIISVTNFYKSFNFP